MGRWLKSRRLHRRREPRRARNFYPLRARRGTKKYRRECALIRGVDADLGGLIAAMGDREIEGAQVGGEETGAGAGGGFLVAN